MGTLNLTLMLISWTWGCTTFHNFISIFKKKIKSWQVCDWLAKWLIMSGYMDLRRPRVYRSSNIGLVLPRNSADNKSSLVHCWSATIYYPNQSQIARFMGPSWDPPGEDRTQVGPMLAPWTLLSMMITWFNEVYLLHWAHRNNCWLFDFSWNGCAYGDDVIAARSC